MKIGLYIETKMFNFYKHARNINIAELLYKNLEKYGLETVEKANAKLPIIVECFEKESLKTFATLSDLPLIYLFWWMNPMVSLYDLNEISQFAHGVGPKYEFIF
jgi:glycerophosphoryl diester phosphodiesterase